MLAGPPPDTSRLGGSDIAALLGRHPFKTTAEVYGRLTGARAEVMNEAMTWGVLLEPLIAMAWAACWEVSLDKGVAVTGVPVPWGRMSPDYLVSTSSSNPRGPQAGDIVEIKTTGEDRYRDGWGDDPPSYIVDQCMWYLGGLGRQAAWVVCLVGGQRMTTRRIDFEPGRFMELLDAGQKFIDTYFDGVPP